MHAYGDTEHYHSLAFTEILFCYNFGYAVLGNRLNVTSHQNHHQHQRITKVRADKGHTKRSLQSAVVGKKICIRILLVRSAVTVRILHVVQSADPHVRRSAFYQKPLGSDLVLTVNSNNCKVVMAVTLHYFTEFGKHTFQHITAASICGGIYARVYCIL